jgi:hypothetical protein
MPINHRTGVCLSYPAGFYHAIQLVLQRGFVLLLMGLTEGILYGGLFQSKDLGNPGHDSLVSMFAASLGVILREYGSSGERKGK